jgi:CheY-like chemotaxis protein
LKDAEAASASFGRGIVVAAEIRGSDGENPHPEETLEIPHPEERPIPSVEPASPVFSIRPYLLLVAEDVKVSRKLLRLVLSRMLPAAKIVEAKNGEEAVQMFAQFSPDLVVMDMHMPLKNGCDATREIREIEKNHGRRTPVIALTADMEPESRETCLQAGMDGYLPKPVEEETLRDVLDRFLPAR